MIHFNTSEINGGTDLQHHTPVWTEQSDPPNHQCWFATQRWKDIDYPLPNGGEFMRFIRL